MSSDYKRRCHPEIASRLATARNGRFGRVVLATALLATRLAAQLPPDRTSAPWLDPNPSWDVAVAELAPAPGAKHVAGQVLVGLDVIPSRQAFLSAASARGHALLGEIPRLGILKLSCRPGHETSAAGELRSLPGVRFAEINGLGSAMGVEDLNDPCVPDQWHLENNGSAGGLIGADLDVDEAWAITAGSPKTVVAVLDTGIEFDHPEFVARLLPGYDFVNEDPDPTSSGYHGIFQSGLIGAIADNGFAGTGLDQACSILPVKVLNGAGQGQAFDLCQGLDYATAAGVDVVNMSLGGYVPEESLKTALHAAYDAGCILVSAAGNVGQAASADKSWPGASPDTISVGATNSADVKSSISLTGNALDFIAPGEDIHSCHSETAPTQCLEASGTSMACALTSGVAALLLSIRPDLTQEQVYALLAAGSKDQIGPPAADQPGWDKKYGYGRISAGASLRILDRLLASLGSHGVPSLVDFEKGGHQLIVTRVDPELRGYPWITLGSVSGTLPGTWVGHAHVPLNLDDYFSATLAGSGELLHPAYGIVPDDGVILQSVDVPAKWQPDLGIQQIEHAVVVVHVQPVVSEPVTLAIDP